MDSGAVRISILLDNSAFTQTKTEEGKFLWDLALDENKEKIVSSLLPHIPSKLRYPYFRTAVNEERSTVIELLVNDSSFCEGQNGKRLWDLALEEGDVPTVQRLATRIPEQDRYPFFKHSIENKQAGITTVLTSSSDFIQTKDTNGNYFGDLALQENDRRLIDKDTTNFEALTLKSLKPAHKKNLYLALPHLLHLKELDLTKCSWLTDTELEHIANLQNLQQLELRNCNKITDGAIDALKEHLPNLTVSK